MSRVVVVPTKTLRGKQWHSLRDLGRPLIDEIESFLIRAAVSAD